MTQDQGLMDAAARYRRQAIADARQAGISREQVATALGVTPPRITQISKGVKASPPPPADPSPRVLVQRALPTPPADRGSKSLFLVEAERQGIEADRKMLYIGLETVNDYVARVLHLDEGADVLARRKMMLANSIPVRIATSYFRPNLFDNTRIAEPEFVQPSLQAAIHELGYNFERAEEFLVSRRPTPFEFKTLDLDLTWVTCCFRGVARVADLR